MATVAHTSRSAPRPRIPAPVAAYSAATPPDEAVRAYLPLVRWLVQRLAVRKPPQVELDEMVSWGIEGLLDAMKKYDPTKQAASKRDDTRTHCGPACARHDWVHCTMTSRLA